METEITFVGGRVETFPASMEIKMTPYGVEVLSREDEDVIRVLFPWGQIEKISQRGTSISAVYTY